MPEDSGKGRNSYFRWIVTCGKIQEAVDWQLKQHSTDQADNQVNAVRGKLDGNKNPRKGKMCLSCRQEGQFSQDKECRACGQTCRKCGETCHFKVKCPQLCGTQDQGHPLVDMTEGVPVDRVEMDVDVVDERENLWLEDLIPEKRTKEILLPQVVCNDRIVAL